MSADMNKPLAYEQTVETAEQDLPVESATPEWIEAFVASVQSRLATEQLGSRLLERAQADFEAEAVEPRRQTVSRPAEIDSQAEKRAEQLEAARKVLLIGQALAYARQQELAGRL